MERNRKIRRGLHVGRGKAGMAYMETEQSTGQSELKLTEDEAEQYDRQIRLWGLEAQKRLRASSVLVVGLRGLGAEVCKNVVLAGVRSVTMMDPYPLGPEDIGGRFLTFTEGENRAQQAVSRLQVLNPNVTVTADTDRVEDKPDDYFSRFEIICATCCTTSTLLRLDELSRARGIRFFCGDVWGYYGYFFADLNQHDYAVEVPRQEEESVMVDGPRTKRVNLDRDAQTVTVKKSCCFCSLKAALSVDWSKKPAKYFRRTPATFFVIQTLQAFRDQCGDNPSSSSAAADSEKLLSLKDEVATKYGISTDIITEEFSNTLEKLMSSARGVPSFRHCFSELSPVCAIVGGVLGQEIIKAISAKDRPYHNCFLYDGIQNTGIVESLSP